MPPKSEGRMLRKDISRSRGAATLSPKALSLFCLLVPWYNVHGKMEANPHAIKGTVCPFIEWLDIKTIEACLKEITDKTNVKWFQVDRCWYLHSLNYGEHQDFKRKGRDYLPAYSRELRENSGRTPGVVHEYSKSGTELLLPEVEPDVEPDVEPEPEKNKGFVVPPIIREEVWLGFEEMRRRIKKPLTNRARSLIVSKLKRLGNDPNRILEESTMNCWAGVFPIKEKDVAKPVDCIGRPLSTTNT